MLHVRVNFESFTYTTSHSTRYACHSQKKTDSEDFPSALDDPELIEQFPPPEEEQDSPLTSKSVDSQRPPNTVQVANDQTMKDFKLEQMVDAALFASWKALPWQSRGCPRSLEERESVRLLAAMVQEARRVKGWVGEVRTLES